MRFLKFMLFGLAIYSLYEFARGLMGYGDEGGDNVIGNSPVLNRALNQETSRLQTLTGEGVGHDEQTLDSDGSSVHHRVGRGVVVH